MAKSNHSTALPIEAPVTALRTSPDMTFPPECKRLLSISLTGGKGSLSEKDSGDEHARVAYAARSDRRPLEAAMTFARHPCLYIRTDSKEVHGDGLAADRLTAGVGQRPPGIAGEGEGAHPRS